MARNGNAVQLTKAIIEKKPLPESGYERLWDAKVRGLFLRITPSGRRTWSVRYTSQHGKSQDAKLGPYPALTVEAARRKAIELLARVHSGEDPAAERRERRQAVTVEQLCSMFMAEHVQLKLRPTTAAEYQRLIDKHIVPRLGRQRVDMVTSDMIDEVHVSLEDTPRQANHLLSVLSKMFSFAVRRELRPDRSNPAKGQDRYRENKRERFLTSDEKRRLLVVLDELDRQQIMSEAVLAIRLLFLTGRRKSEILTLRWTDLDLERGTMRLPDSKVGAVTFRLTETVVALLQRVKQERQDGATDEKRVSQSPYVIPGRRYDQPMKNISKPWERIREMAELEDVRLHDLRHTYASWCAIDGMDLLHIKRLMGHASIQTTQRYAHLNDESERQALLRAEEALQR
jgi:integrase